MSYIDIIDHPEAEGELKEIYDDLLKKRGKLAEVHKIQSLNPKTITGHMDLYMSVMFGRSPLKRYQREMIGVVVSAANNCDYCQQHHGEALNHFWKDEKRVMALREFDYKSASLSPGNIQLCEFARETTVYPGKTDHEENVGKLKESGFSDRSVLDTALVTSYFNFVNRMVLSLGVKLEKSKGSGYKYD